MINSQSFKGTARSLPKDVSLKVFYGSIMGSAKAFAEQLVNNAGKHDVSAELVDFEDYDPDDLSSEEALCVFVLATYEHGTPSPNAQGFHTWLLDIAQDFREDQKMMQNVRYAIFGLGHSDYSDNFCKVALDIDAALSGLHAKRVHYFGVGDQNVTTSLCGGMERDFDDWEAKFWQEVTAIRGATVAEEELLYETESGEESAGEDGEDGSGEESGVMDIENLGNMVARIKGAKAKRRQEEEAAGTTEAREMITPALRKALTKQGYRLIGSHSGVKLCRWTKAMLRGRGGCYKHTFYGIASHRCMETTPSLACANKCVFCWRHHTNPVGTEWRWKMDDPEMIIDGAMQNHYDMIREFKGVPGVVPQRLKEANEIRHCALSLVGEPIMYPEINRFLRVLHARHISSFMVTNAQFPEAIAQLDPVCQLYVSIDASNKDALKKIDRPLFKDYWERFIDCLKELSKKGQRTVYRLTIVKAWNDDEVQGYADLVAIGKPDFIEIKGVTFCGSSKASTLTMGNVPYHEEIENFVESLNRLLPDYELALEHEHSTSLCLVNKKFKINGRWYTWIDYEKFHQLVDAGKPFTSLDYVAPTPEWAIRGHEARGFDPLETRHYRKKQKDISGC